MKLTIEYLTRVVGKAGCPRTLATFSFKSKFQAKKLTIVGIIFDQNLTEEYFSMTVVLSAVNFCCLDFITTRPGRIPVLC